MQFLGFLVMKTSKPFYRPMQGQGEDAAVGLRATVASALAKQKPEAICRRSTRFLMLSEPQASCHESAVPEKMPAGRGFMTPCLNT